MASFCPGVVQKKNTDLWIRHFEDQAKTGASERTFLNRRYISVCDSSGIQSVGPSSATGSAQPPVVAPVEQAVAQAAAEVQRDKTSLEREAIEKQLKLGARPALPCAPFSAGGGGAARLKKRRKQVLVPRDIFS